MKLTLHTGTHTIGGSCIEISTKNTRIIIDLGVPLTDKDGNRINTREISRKTTKELIDTGFLPNVPELFYNKSSAIDAIFITHSHLDHYGFMPRINTNIPVYMSRGCKDLIKCAKYFDQTKYDSSNAKAIPSWKPVEIGDLKVTPYLVDHSAFDAFAYLVEGDGKRIFYTGDFRGHGRKKILFENMLKWPLKDIDLLITEGTTLKRDLSRETKSEEEVFRQLVREFSKSKGLTLISSSSQNIDRMTSIYNACKEAGKTFVIIPYTAAILKTIKRKEVNVIQYSYPGISVLFVRHRFTDKMAKDNSLFQYAWKKIQYEGVGADKGNMVVLDSHNVRDRLAELKMLNGARLIYSQWEKYLDGQESFWEENGVEIVKVHTSGHVTPSDLKKFVKAVNPKKISPMHTLAAESFREFFGDKVVELNNGESIEV
jgi:ribonuclease J